jgi:hypothetical protein
MPWTPEELDNLKKSLEAQGVATKTAAPNKDSFFAELDRRKQAKSNIGNVLNQNVAAMAESVPSVKAPVEKPKQDTGIISNLPPIKMAMDITSQITPERKAEFAKTKESLKSGDIGTLQAGLRNLGDIAGIGNDYIASKIGEVAGAVKSKLPANAQSMITDTGSALGGVVKQAANSQPAVKLMNNLVKFSEKNPKAAEFVKENGAALLNILSLGLDVGGVGALSNMTKNKVAKEIVEEVVTQASKATKSEQANILSQAVDAMKSKLDRGSVIQSRGVDDIADLNQTFKVRSSELKNLESPINAENLSPSEMLALSERTSVKASPRQKMIGIGDDEAKVIRENPEMTREFIDVAKARNLNTKSPALLEYATTKIDEATELLNKTLKDTGSEIGKFREMFGDKLANTNEVPRVFEAFENNLKKLNLYLDNGEVKQIKTAVKNSTNSDVAVLQEFYDNLSLLKENPSLKNIIDNRISIDNRINFAKDSSEVSGAIDPIARDLRSVLADINVKSVPADQAAAIAEYSNYMEAIEKLNSFTKNKTGKEFLLKQVLSERGRNARNIIDIVRKYTGVDLNDVAVLSKKITDLIGNDSQKGLFNQEIKNSVGGVIDAVRGRGNSAVGFFIDKAFTKYNNAEKILKEMIANPVQKAKLMEKIDVSRPLPANIKTVPVTEMPKYKNNKK